MSLKEIEMMLAYYRIDLGLRLIKGDANSLQLPVVEKVEQGGNYNLSSLFAYIKAIGMELEANETKISSTEELGIFLRTKREECGQTLADVKWGTRRGYREITKLESGGGSRMNLWNYLGKLNYKINFKLIDKHGVAKEKERERERDKERG